MATINAVRCEYIAWPAGVAASCHVHRATGRSRQCESHGPADDGVPESFEIAGGDRHLWHTRRWQPSHEAPSLACSSSIPPLGAGRCRRAVGRGGRVCQRPAAAASTTRSPTRCEPGCRSDSACGPRLAGTSTARRLLRAAGNAAGRQRRLKPLEAVVDDQPLVGPAMLRLTEWMADYYLCGWGQVLEAVVPAGVRGRAGTRRRSSCRCPITSPPG